MKCVGVIVTYNRCDLLIENLKSLENQTKQFDTVIIIDNHSTDGTEEKVKRIFKNSKLNIDYRYMDDNYGGAGGFYYGVKFAYEANADFVYLMDDDGKPYDENTFDIIYRKSLELYKNNKLLFINSFVTCDGKNLSFGFGLKGSLEKQLRDIEKSGERILFNKANPFNGTLISKELINKIGYPRKEFFLSRDETDYMARSFDAKAIVATIVDSVYIHPKSKLKLKKIFGITTAVYDNLDKEYYFVRNMTYTYKDTHKIKIYKHIFMRIITIVLYEDKKMTRIKQLFSAIKDALNGNMGKRK